MAKHYEYFISIARYKEEETAVFNVFEFEDGVVELNEWGDHVIRYWSISDKLTAALPTTTIWTTEECTAQYPLLYRRDLPMNGGWARITGCLFHKLIKKYQFPLPEEFKK